MSDELGKAFLAAFPDQKAEIDVSIHGGVCFAAVLGGTMQVMGDWIFETQHASEATARTVATLKAWDAMVGEGG